MYRLETHIAIDAPIERVWSLLMDCPGHARWNPFIRSVEGRPEVGQSLNVFIQPPGGRGRWFRPTVLAAEPNRALRWKGKLRLPGVFDGEHFFEIAPNPAGGLTFHHGEVFSGILVPLFRGLLDGEIREGFIAMNEALKREAETG